MSNKHKKILIIEDEKPIARALELKLTYEGFETTVTFDGESALKKLEKETFDLILCDLVMPKVDGFKVLEAIKNKKVATPVMVLTNLGQQDDEERARSLGAKEFFIKADTPITDIVKRITQFLK